MQDLNTMPALHHVSIVTRDLDRACGFYSDLIGLTRIPRPNFTTPGIWLQAGDLSVHLILWPQGHFRQQSVVDPADTHFALAVEDFDATMTKLQDHGYRLDATAGDPHRLVVLRNGVAGYAQAYLLDPDWNILELNAARLTPSGL